MALAGTERVRVPKEFTDHWGNLMLPPTAAYLVDEAGTPHASSSTGGRLPVDTGIGDGGVRIACGTFTKDAVGTTGSVQVTAGTDDVLYLMYGYVVIGPTHAGAASELRAGIVGSAGTSDLLALHLYDATADADEFFTIPTGLGEVSVAGGLTVSRPSFSHQNMIPNLNRMTQDGPGAISGQPRYIIEYETMANTETFLYALYFFSVDDTAVVSTAGAGAIA